MESTAPSGGSASSCGNSTKVESGRVTLTNAGIGRGPSIAQPDRARCAPTGDPTLACANRQILRSHPGEDFRECDAMWTQPQVVKYAIGDVSPTRRTWQRLLACR